MSTKRNLTREDTQTFPAAGGVFARGALSPHPHKRRKSTETAPPITDDQYQHHNTQQQGYVDGEGTTRTDQ
jgi:hypothetical protein